VTRTAGEELDREQPPQRPDHERAKLAGPRRP
jgi:hypothetical protein